MSSPRILIVENEGIVAADIETRLRHVGCQTVGTAGSGEQALALVQGLHPDLILMDIRLDGSMDGIEVARLIRDRHHCPVVFLTAYAEEATLQRAKQVDPFGFVVKPFDDRELRVVIEMALYKHQAEEEIRRLTRVYGVLSQVNQRLARASSCDELLAQTCRVLAEQGGYNAAWIAWPDPATRELRIAARSGDPEGCLDRLPLDSMEASDALSLATKAIQEGRPCVANSIRQDPLTAGWAETMAELGVEAAAALPVPFLGQPCGVLCLGCGVPGSFKEKEIALLEQVAMDVAFGLDKIEESEQRRAAEERLRVSEERFRMLFEHAPVAYQSLDERGCFLEVNRTWLEMMHYSREEVMGRCFGDFLAPGAEASFRACISNLWEAGESRAAEFEMRRKDGQRILVSFHARAGQDPRGILRQAHCVMQDVTQLKQAEAALREATRAWQQIFEAIGHPTLILDPTNHVIAANRAAVKASGVGLDQLLNRRCHEVFHGAAAPPGSCPFNPACVSGSVRTSEMEVDTLKGVFLISCTPVHDEEGRLEKIIHIATEITEHKKAEQRLRESEARYRRLVELSPDAIFIERDDCFVFANAAGLRLFGARESQQVLGRKVLDFVPAENREAVAEHFRRVKGEQQTTLLIEQKFQRVDGRVVDVELGGAPFVHEGQPAVQIIARDITSRKQMEVQLLRTQRMDTLGTLASGIAHDLNNVLVPILMTAPLLHERYPDEHSRALLEAMETSAQRGANIVKQLLTFGRGAGGQRVLLQPKHLLKEMGRIIEETFPKSIQLRMTSDQAGWPVQGDATQLHQVLLNLCVNARDAMPNGGALHLKVENVQLDDCYVNMNPEARPGPYVVISVQDSGTGIPPEVRDKIFEPFFTTKEPGKGSGLGLATCQNIVRNHSGFVELFTETAKGSVFRVYLPASPDAAVIQAPPAETGSLRGHGEWILVVDDEVTVRQITQRILEKNGYQVLTANDGADGVAACAQNQQRIRAVVIDMMMPVMDGPSAIRVMRRIAPGLPIIASSGAVTKEMEVQLAELEPNAFLAKPYTAQQLLSSLSRILQQETATRPLSP